MISTTSPVDDATVGRSLRLNGLRPVAASTPGGWVSSGPSTHACAPDG